MLSTFVSIKEDVLTPEEKEAFTKLIALCENAGDCRNCIFYGSCNEVGKDFIVADALRKVLQVLGQD